MKNLFAIALTILTFNSVFAQTSYNDPSANTIDPNFDDNRKLVMVISQGADDERASIAWSIANGGIKNGLDVRVFLVGSGVEWATKRMNKVHLNPLDPSLGEMIQSASDKGARIGVCPPCLTVRGIERDEVRDDVEVIGSSFIHDAIKEGAAIMTF